MSAEFTREFIASTGVYSEAVKSAFRDAEREGVIQRIWNRDASLWKSEPDQQKIIENSLGWLTVAQEMTEVSSELQAFADEIRRAGFKHVIVCGMGGSSLCPEVLAKTFGPQVGYPELLVLDSTDPDAIATLEKQIDVEHCLFVIASKSGTTTEPLCFYKYWYHEVAARKQNPGESFVLITDPGSPMIADAQSRNFRRIFLNQPQIGGRYSALSYFGMVPATLMGLDVADFLQRAAEGSRLSGPMSGAVIGAVMGECAKAGRDKLTLVIDERLATLGLWIEQLVAESTGKEGKGILPVAGEPLGVPENYGNDRVFVSITLNALPEETKARLDALQAAGHPIVYRTLKEPYDLGGEFFIWEFATAFAGWLIGINPFDQPNVQESKDATKSLLKQFVESGVLTEPEPLVSDDSLTVYAADASSLPRSGSVLEILRTHFSRLKPGDYLAFLDYIEETPAIEAALQSIRTFARDATRCATTTGYGPRFLHSTGQLHKGGPDTGVFIQLTAPDQTDLPIPGEPYTFSVLKQAQALGDFAALSSRGRRAIRVDLGDDAVAGLARLEELVVKALS